MKRKTGMKLLAAFMAVMGAVAACLGAGSAFFFKLLFARVQPKGTEKILGGMDPDDPDVRARKKMEAETLAWAEGQKCSDLTVRSFDGLLLHARLIWAEEDTDKTMLLVHGFHGRPQGDFAGVTKFYHKMGFNVLWVDDRAHGKSEGNWLGFSWLDRLDVVAWCRELVLLFGPGAKIVLHGVSMGGAAVMMASGEEDLPKEVAGIIDDCGFTTALEEVRHVFPDTFRLLRGPVFFFSTLASKIKFGYYLSESSSLKQLQKNERPILFIHGGADDFVPTRMVHELYEATKGPRRLYIAEGAGHALSYARDPERYEREVLDFLRSIGFAGEEA